MGQQLSITGKDPRALALQAALSLVEAPSDQGSVLDIFNEAQKIAATPEEDGYDARYIALYKNKDQKNKMNNRPEATKDALALLTMQQQIEMAQKNGDATVEFENLDTLRNTAFDAAKAKYESDRTANLTPFKRALEETVSGETRVVASGRAGTVKRDGNEDRKQIQSFITKEFKGNQKDPERATFDEIELQIYAAQTKSDRNPNDAYYSQALAILNLEKTYIQQQAEVEQARRATAPKPVTAATSTTPASGKSAAGGDNTGNKGSDAATLAVLSDEDFLKNTVDANLSLTHEDKGNYHQNKSLVATGQQLLVEDDEKALKLHGVDGKDGDETTGAVTAFQAKHHLKSTGQFDAATIGALYLARVEKLTEDSKGKPLSSETKQELEKQFANVQHVQGKLSDESKKELAAFLPTLQDQIKQTPDNASLLATYKAIAKDAGVQVG